MAFNAGIAEALDHLIPNLAQLIPTVPAETFSALEKQVSQLRTFLEPTKREQESKKCLQTFCTTVLKLSSEDVAETKILRVGKEKGLTEIPDVHFVLLRELCKRGQAALSLIDNSVVVIDKKQRGRGQSSISSFTKSEKKTFIRYINDCMKESKTWTPLPADDPQNELFERLKDGTILCTLVNHAAPGTISEKAISYPTEKAKLTQFQIAENLNLGLKAAKEIGCVVVNVSNQDISEGRPAAVLGVLWQLMRLDLLKTVNVITNGNVIVLKREDETIEQFMALSNREILLRWINYVLKKDLETTKYTAELKPLGKPIDNFAGDLKDSEVYIRLIRAVAPEVLTIEEAKDVLLEQNLLRRAARVIEIVKRLKPSREIFIDPEDIVGGASRLNIAYIATIFEATGETSMASDETEDMLKMTSLRIDVLDIALEYLAKEFPTVRSQKFTNFVQAVKGLSKMTQTVSQAPNNVKLKKVQLELDEAKHEVEEQKQHIAQLQQQQQEKEKKYNEDINRIQIMAQQQFLEKTKQIETIEKYNEKLLNEKHQQIEEVSRTLTKQLLDKQSELEKVQKEKESKQQELQETIREAHDTKSRLETENHMLQHRLAEYSKILTEKVSEASSQLSELGKKSEIQLLEKQIELENCKFEHSKQIHEKDTTIEQLQKQIKELKATHKEELKKKKTKILGLKNENAALLKQLNTEVAAANHEINTLDIVVQSKSSYIKKLESHITNLENNIEQRRDVENAMQNELNKLFLQLTDHKKQIENGKVQLQKMTEERETAARKAKDLVQKVLALKQVLVQTRKDLDYGMTIAGENAETKLAIHRFGQIDAMYLMGKNPKKTGFLEKKGSQVKNWKKRFFILIENYLFYYKDHKASSPAGFLRLDDCMVEEGKSSSKSFVFKVYTAKRELYCSAEDETSCLYWIYDIRQAGATDVVNMNFNHFK